MAIWNWPLRRTMQVRGLSTVLTAFPGSGKPGTTCSGCKVLTFGRDLDVWMARSSIRTQSASPLTLLAERFLQTTEERGSNCPRCNQGLSRTTGQAERLRSFGQWVGG